MNRLRKGAAFALVATCFLLGPLASAGTSSFCGEFIPWTAGSYPSGIVASDVDGDRLTDLVVANEADYSISVFWSNGDATFRRLDIPIGVAPVEVAARDLDGDGVVDLISAAPDGFLTVVRGNGAGGFNAPSHYPAGTSPWSLALADLNGDGALDAVLGSFYSTTVSVLLGSAGGAFGPPSTIDLGVGGAFYAVAVDDVTDDHIPDIVAARTDSSTVQIFAGRGDGTFDQGPNYRTGHDPQHVALADLNADGVKDILVASLDDNAIFVHLGAGHGTFAPPQSFRTGNGPFWVQVFDVNGDGFVDIIAPNNNDATVSVLLGNGTGSFAPKMDFATGNAPRSLAVADFNGDGRADVAAANLGSGTLSVLIQNADGTFGCRERYGAGDHAQNAVITNLDGDRWPDVAVLNRWAYPGTITVWHGSRTGELVGREDLELVYASPSSMVAADLNRDGISDLVVTTAGRYVVSIFRGGPGGFAPRQDIDFVGCPFGVTLADLTGDHHSDIAATDPCDSTVVILKGDGEGGFSAVSRYPVLAGAEAVAAGDLNRDGRTDLVVVNRLSNSISVLLQGPHGEFPTREDYGAGEEPTFAVIADVSEDGFPDVVVSNLSRTRAGSIFLGAGDGTLAPPEVLQGDHFAESVAVGDVDLDGHVDIVFPDMAGNTASILWGLGASRFSDPVGIGAGFNPSSVAIGDLDLDRRPDLIVANKISQDISVYRNRGPRPPAPPANSLIGNRPNPFNPGTIISYVVAQPGRILIRIYDTAGRLVRVVQDEVQASGPQTSFWDGRMDSGAAAPSGVYFCRVTFPGGQEQSRKLALVR